MIKSVRDAYNQAFTEEIYSNYLRFMNESFGHEIEFRIAETPVFIPTDLRRKILRACDDIIDVIKEPDFKKKTQKAVPKECYVPDETAHTNFLAIDFAICQDQSGELEPQLIELQGFPSLFMFQEFVSQAALKMLPIPQKGFDYLFSGLTSETYIELMRKVICGNHDPENVVLLEIEPHEQKTKVDFYATQKYLGVRPVCITEVIKEGKELYYQRDGVKTRIRRVYNRVIFDELVKRQDLAIQWNLIEGVDIEWAGHPNWFFRISKYTLPFLKSKYVPETQFLDKIEEVPADLENYVLKPLFSFAGAGVKINVTRTDLDEIIDPENWILMKKVHYAPALESPDGPVKVEIRMLFVWPDQANNPMLVTSLVRLSKGEMIGVRYNQDKTWVGGTMAFFQNDDI